jgi:predicted nucleic acid-binding protein
VTLVDTSVWMRAIYGREPFAARLLRLLEQDAVAGHLVYGELLMGGPVGRQKFLAAYEPASVRGGRRLQILDGRRRFGGCSRKTRPCE